MRCSEVWLTALRQREVETGWQARPRQETCAARVELYLEPCLGNLSVPDMGIPNHIEPVWGRVAYVVVYNAHVVITESKLWSIPEIDG